MVVPSGELVIDEVCGYDSSLAVSYSKLEISKILSENASQSIAVDDSRSDPGKRAE